MKERLDVLLVQKGYAPSREKAKAIIMSGNVFIDGQREDSSWKKLLLPLELSLKKPFVWILELLPGVLRTVCFKMGQKKYML